MEEYGFAQPKRCEWCAWVTFALCVALWIATYVVIACPLDDLV